jgi:Domain of unknown function (DUF4974)
MDKNSPQFKTKQKIARISLLTSVILVGIVIWGNYQRNKVGDKTLSFDNTPMVEAFVIIEKTYLCDVMVQDAALADCFVTGTFTDKTLDEVLTSMSNRYQFKLVRQGPRTFTVSGGKCKR